MDQPTAHQTLESLLEFGVTPENSRIVRIKNTLEMTTVWDSEPMVAGVKENQDQTLLSEPFNLEFDANGALTGQVIKH